MKRRMSLWSMVLLSVLALVFTACGGGGGDNEDVPGNATLEMIIVYPGTYPPPDPIVTPQIVNGTTMQFSALGVYTDGVDYFEKDLSDKVTWSVEYDTKITISSTGLVTGVGFGFSRVFADFNGKSGWLFAQVISNTLVSVTVTPSSASVEAGRTVQLSASGKYEDGRTVDLTTSATWSSADEGVATVDASGLVTGQAEGGPIDITAEKSGLSGSASVTVTPAVPDLEVTVDHVTDNGADVTLHYTVYNNGTKDSGPFTVDLWEDRASPPVIGNTSASVHSYGDLALGGHISNTITITSALDAGTAYAVVDTSDTVTESEENDNISIGCEWPAEVALFNNIVYLDSTLPDHLKATIKFLGHGVNTFKGITATHFASALAQKNYLVIPSMDPISGKNLSDSMDTAAHNAIKDFVYNGGTLVVISDEGFNANKGNAEKFLNATFGYSLGSVHAVAGNPVSLNGPGAAGTIFEGSMPNIGGRATRGIDPPTLPTGARKIYIHGTTSSSVVTLIPYGSGSIVVFGCGMGWGPPTGTSDGGWVRLLDLALGGPGDGRVYYFMAFAHQPSGTGSRISLYGADATTLLSSSESSAYSSPRIYYYMKSGETCYIKMEESTSLTPADFYALHVNDIGPSASIPGGVPDATDPDIYEPDDTSGGATPLEVRVAQKHSFSSPGGDVDWFVFTAP